MPLANSGDTEAGSATGTPVVQETQCLPHCHSTRTHKLTCASLQVGGSEEACNCGGLVRVIHAPGCANM